MLTYIYDEWVRSVDVEFVICHIAKQINIKKVTY